MSIDFSTVKEWTIPEGKVKSISVNGAQIWSGEKSEPPVRLSWEHVFWSIEQGSYATDYSIGDLIPLNLGTEGNINMQIAAFDADDLASGSGKAHISFISKELLKTSKRMNITRSPTSAPFNEGTGSVGGWEKCEMRVYLNDTIKPLIPNEVRSAIVKVTKTQTSYRSNTTVSNIQTTQDDVWLPAWDEIKDSSSLYGSLFTSDTTRKKKIVEKSSFVSWWTREAGSTSKSFASVWTDGKYMGAGSSDVKNIALGFCL